MRQWALRITDYAERLLEDMNELKDWPTYQGIAKELDREVGRNAHCIQSKK